MGPKQNISVCKYIHIYIYVFEQMTSYEYMYVSNILSLEFLASEFVTVCFLDI